MPASTSTEAQPIPRTVAPATVRYIKLGRRGGWEAECLREGIGRFGYATERPERFKMAVEGRWDDVRRAFIDDSRPPGTATRFTNDVRHFFFDGHQTLWITFHRERLWWAFFQDALPEQHTDGHGTFRRVVDRWQDTDHNGDQLSFDRLSGALTKIAAYRSTTFALDRSSAEYVVRRIIGLRSPAVDHAVAALTDVRGATRDLLGLLGWRDFEVLVDLVFTASGWRRIGELGKTQKTIDLDVVLPSTGERAFVQVKSHADDRELASYASQLDELGPFRRMFFVYHSGAVTDPDDDRVVVIGPDKLAELVVGAGLVDWLVGKVS